MGSSSAAAALAAIAGGASTSLLWYSRRIASVWQATAGGVGGASFDQPTMQLTMSSSSSLSSMSASVLRFIVNTISFLKWSVVDASFSSFAS